MYLDALAELSPWFHALNHTNYARWLPVHLRDMVELPIKHPGIAKEFSNGSFTVKKPAGFSLPLLLTRLTNKLKREAAKNFADYATNIFILYVDSQLCNVSHVDLVWNVSRIL